MYRHSGRNECSNWVIYTLVYIGISVFIESLKNEKNKINRFLQRIEIEKHLEQ